MGLVQVVPHGDGDDPLIDGDLAQDVHILSLSGEAGHLVCPVHCSLHLAHTLICGDQLPQLSQQLRRHGLWLLGRGWVRIILIHLSHDTIWKYLQLF